MLFFSQSPRFELFAVIGSICAFSFCVGFIYPVISLALEARGHDADAIGLSATATGVGIFLGGIMIPRMVGLFGTFWLLVGSAVLAIAVLLMFPLIQDYWAWFSLRFLLGVAVTALFATGEAWINAIAEDHSRGRIMAIYVSAMASCFAIGSFAVKVVGFIGFLPFILAGCVIFVCFLPILPFHDKDPLAEADGLQERGGLLLEVFRQAIVLMGVVALFGILDSVVLGLLPIYALVQGVSEADASLPIAAMAIGVVACQIPLGYLSDRMSRTRLLTIILFLVVGFAALIPEVDLTHWSGLGFMVIFGGLSFAPYTIALAILGQRYQGRRLAAGSALFAVMWGLGGTVGPMAFGVAMTHFGPSALPYGLALLFLLTASVSLLDRTPVAIPSRFRP